MLENFKKRKLSLWNYYDLSLNCAKSCKFLPLYPAYTDLLKLNIFFTHTEPIGHIIV